MPAAARELEGLNRTAPHIAQMLNDYGVERNAIRECRKRRAYNPAGQQHGKIYLVSSCANL